MPAYPDNRAINLLWPLILCLLFNEHDSSCLPEASLLMVRENMSTKCTYLFILVRVRGGWLHCTRPWNEHGPNDNMDSWLSTLDVSKIIYREQVTKCNQARLGTWDHIKITCMRAQCQWYYLCFRRTPFWMLPASSFLEDILQTKWA